MAFRSAAGYGNLPNGNFSPVIYSKKVQTAFRKTSVVEDITNNDYMGEISNFGDSVRIIKEPEVSVQGLFPWYTGCPTGSGRRRFHSCYRSGKLLRVQDR
jgi:hypothetical protein